VPFFTSLFPYPFPNTHGINHEAITDVLHGCLLESIPHTKETFYALYRRVVVARIERIAVWVVDGYIFVERVKGAEKRVFRHKVEKVFSPAVNFETAVECFRCLNVHECEPG